MYAHGGLGIAFGKFAETDNLVDSAWKIKSTNGFEGNATSATNATNTNVTNTNPSTGTWYYPTFVSGTSGNQAHRVNNGFRQYTLEGTASALGTSYLQLGNSTANGTAGNKKGILRIHGQNTGRTDVSYANSTSNVAQTIPALNGTFIVKQSATIATETNGWYKVDMGGYTQYFKSGEIPSQSYSANGWGWLTTTTNHYRDLPSGVTFNSAKMIFSGNARCTDAAIVYNVVMENSGTQLSITWRNNYGSAITTTGKYNWSLIVFP